MPALAYWITAALLALSALALLAWSLFADRARGRARCPRCWYAMSGRSADASLRCPECGHTAPHERALYRTRRRWRLAMLATLLILAAAPMAIYPSARGGGYKQLLPITGIIAATYLTDEPWPFEELRRRVVDEYQLWSDHDALRDWQWRWATNRCAAAISSDAPTNTKRAAMVLLFYNSPVPRRALPALTTALNDADTRVSFLAAWGAKAARFDLHPIPESFRAALVESAARGPDPRSQMNAAELALEAFDDIPPDWRPPPQRNPPPTPDEVADRLSGAYAIDLAAVHHELGVRSRSLTWAYNGESGPFQVQRRNLEIDGREGEDSVLLIGDSQGIHWQALVFLRRGEHWAIGGSLELMNSGETPPAFRSLTVSGATWLIQTRTAGHTPGTYEIRQDTWLSFAKGRPALALRTWSRGLGISPQFPTHGELKSAPPTVIRSPRGWTIEYPVTLEFNPGTDLWLKVNGEQTAPQRLFTRSGIMRFESEDARGPFAEAAESSLLSTSYVEDSFLGYPHEFIAANLDDLLNLARTGSPEIRAYLKALAETANSTPQVEQLRHELHRPR